MIGEEMARLTAMINRENMELFFKLLSKLIDMQGRKGKNEKISIGELSAKEYKNMLEKGEKFQLIDVPKDKLPEIEKYAKALGASYHIMEGDGNTALAAVSENSFRQFSDAIKQTVKNQLSEDEKSVEVMDKDNIIPAEQVELAKEVLQSHDIPVFSFINSDNSCMNVVSKEYGEQYRSAMEEVKDAAEQVRSVKAIPFDNTDQSDIRVKRISEEQADNLAKEFDSEKVSFTKYEGEVFVKFPAEIKGDIEKNIKETDRQESLLSGYETAFVKDAKNYVTIDKKALDVKDAGSELFMKIPKTDGQDYIKLPKKDLVELNGGKTLEYAIDKEKLYDVLDADGNVREKISGAELEKHYESRTEKLFGGKNTQTVHYDVSGGDRVEIYDKAKDKIISIGSGSIDKAESILLENNVAPEAAKALAEKVSQNKAEISYSEENPEKDIKRSKALEAVENMERYGDISENTGKKCILCDEENRKYTVIDPQRESSEKIHKTLISAGYTGIQAAAIMSKLSAVCLRENLVLNEEKSAAKAFENPDKNAELDMYRYSAKDGGAAVIKADKNDKGEDIYKYMTVTENTSRKEFEAALRREFSPDEKTVTDIMKSFDKEKLLPVPEQIVIPNAGYKVSLVSSRTYEISKNGVSVPVNKGKANIPQTAEKLGISEKEAENIIGKIEKSLKNTGRKPTFLSQLRQAKASVPKQEKETKEHTERTVR